MKNYEITFITKEDLSSEGKESSIKKDIEKAGGKVLSESKLGQKTFVYPIKKEKSGFYTSYIFEIETDKLQDLTKRLAMEEHILRHLIVAISPSRELMDAAETIKPADIPVEVKPEEKPVEAVEPIEVRTAIIEPETAIIEPETAIIEPETEIVEAPVEEVVAEEKKEVKTKPAKKEPVAKAEDKKKTEEKPEKKKSDKPTAPDVEPVDEEQRLEALDKKLEELLKE